MCNTQDSFLQECEDTVNREDPCDMAFSSLRNTSFIQSLNETFDCSFDCRLQDFEDGSFKACFTNETNSMTDHNCVGTSFKGKNRLGFIANNVTSLLETASREHIQAGCLVYDLKDVSHEGKAWQILCDRELEFECSISCRVSLEKLKPSCKSTSGAFDKSFFMFFFLFLVANICFSPIFPILDAATYDCLGEKRHLWGKQRIWGTFGFALFAITSTFIMNKKTEDGDVNYSISFYIFGPLCLVAAFIAKFINFSSGIRSALFLFTIVLLF